jgi:mitochondrial fission protein ELM1
MTNKKLAWALFDDRTGNRQQLSGILNKLDFAYKKIDIKYNKYAFLPNFLIQLFGGLLHTKNKKNFNKPPYPKILIACGRRTAPIAIRLYESLSYKPFLIQLMYPSLTLKKKLYNMIIVPEHDKTPNLKNLYKFLGTPNQMSDLLVKQISKNVNKKKR